MLKNKKKINNDIIDNTENNITKLEFIVLLLVLVIIESHHSNPPSITQVVYTLKIKAISGHNNH